MRKNTLFFIILCSLLFLHCDTGKWRDLWNPVTPWIPKANMPTPRADLGCAVINQSIYAVGGYMDSRSGGIPLSVVEEYIPSEDRWITREPLSDSVVYKVHCVSIDGKLYAIGNSTVWRYSPVKDTWDIKTFVPTPRRRMGCGVINGKIYVVGGIDTTYNILSLVEGYDPSTDTWETKSPMPTARHKLTCSVVDAKLYAIGGSNWDSSLCVVEKYNPNTDEWTKVSPTPIPVWNAPSAVVTNKIYVMGAGLGNSEILRYDPLTDEWENEYMMRNPREGACCGVVEGKIYVIGGDEGWLSGGMGGKVEEYNPSLVK